jgi:hypothetical protein
LRAAGVLTWKNIVK